jgi:hypothetical protein
MNNTKRNTRSKLSATRKMGTTQREPRHEVFVQWLTMLLRDEHGRAVIRELVKQHALPVIDLDRGSISAASGHSRP